MKGSNCYKDGVCRARCTVNGGEGDGISIGSCEEGFLCYKEGICLKKGKLSNCVPFYINEVLLKQQI